MDFRDREARTQGGALGPSLIYYSSLGELRDLIGSQWTVFEKVFGSNEEFKSAVTKLVELRDPDAHRRSLFNWQKHMVMGFAGLLRVQIVKFRSKRLEEKDYFSKFTLAYDAEGFYQIPRGFQQKATKRSGERISLVVRAADSIGDGVEYRFFVYGKTGVPYEVQTPWGEATEFSFLLTDAHVRNRFTTGAESRRAARGDSVKGSGEHDDMVYFDYVVLPRLRDEEVEGM